MTTPAAPMTAPADADRPAPVAAAIRLTRPIVLVGMMGAGKSTVGRRLAQRLHCPFADADDEIELAAGMSVAEIFEKFGEAYFRDGERRVIARLLNAGPAVLAAGGGAFADAATRALILERGFAIWLDVPVEVLVERVRRRNHRPLLHGRDARAVLDELLERRGPAYAEAPLRVPSGMAPHERTVEAIIAALATGAAA
jgi:shikimate kinase